MLHKKYIMKFLTKLTAIIFLIIGLASTATAKDAIYTTLFSDKGAGGYDVTAYFSENKAVKGNSAYQTEYMGANWLFASQENLDKFVAAPESYAPQYGGYCAYAAALNQFASGDPEQWSIHDGKLYLNYDKNIKNKWDGNKIDYITKGDKNWPSLISN